jgi:phenylglyoxylate dehydrogenase epsilon subunit
MKKHLIIGTGAAGLAAMKQIHSLSAKDEIRIASMEDTLPYSPTALPYLLSGKIEENYLWIADEDYFREMNSTFAPGKEVVKVSPEDKQVSYRDGDKEGYDTLLIATGSEPVMPTIEGIGDIDPLGFHTIQDYQKLNSRLDKDTTVLLYGGGLVAMGLAAGLIKRGCKVKLIVRSRVLRRYFDPDAGSIITNIFLNQGADILFGSEINKVSKAGKEIEVTLDNGAHLSGNVFVSCLGTRPRVSFLENSGIAIDGSGGVPVDDHLMTNKEDVYAAGDIAVAKDFFTGKPGINAILPSAVEQGKTAGANMAGEATEYQGWISMNVFHFFQNGACSMGISENGKDIEVFKEFDKEKGWLKKLSFQDDHLIGAEFINIDVDPGVIVYLIKNRLNIGANKELLFHKPIDTSRWLMLKNERE